MADKEEDFLESLSNSETAMCLLIIGPSHVIAGVYVKEIVILHFLNFIFGNSHLYFQFAASEDSGSGWEGIKSSHP